MVQPCSWFKEEPSHGPNSTESNLFHHGKNHIQGWMNVRESYVGALEQGTLSPIRSPLRLEMLELIPRNAFRSVRFPNFQFLMRTPFPVSALISSLLRLFPSPNWICPSTETRTCHFKQRSDLPRYPFDFHFFLIAFMLIFL